MKYIVIVFLFVALTGIGQVFMKLVPLVIIGLVPI